MGGRSGQSLGGGVGDNISELADATAKDAEKIHGGDVFGYERYVYNDKKNPTSGATVGELKEKVGRYISTEKIYGIKNVDVPREVMLHSNNLSKKEYDSLLNNGKVEKIKVGDIKISQPNVFEKPLKKAMISKNYKVVVYEYKGKYYLPDGNHRVAAAKMNNVKTIGVVIEKVD